MLADCKPLGSDYEWLHQHKPAAVLLNGSESAGSATTLSLPGFSPAAVAWFVMQALESDVSGLERSLAERTQATSEGQRIVAAAKLARLQGEAQLVAEKRAADAMGASSDRQNHLLSSRCRVLMAARAGAAARRAALAAAVDAFPPGWAPASTSVAGVPSIAADPAAAAAALLTAEAAAIAAAEAAADAARQREAAAVAAEADAAAQAAAAEDEVRRAGARLAAADVQCAKLSADADAARLAGRAVAATLSSTRTVVAASEQELKAAREREAAAGADLREAVATHAEAAARYALVAPGKALPQRLQVTVAVPSLASLSSA